MIPEGQEAAHLGPLPICVLGPSAEALETLDRWGVRTCAALAALPVLDLSERLGPEGVRLHEWARGAGRRSLRLAEPALCFEEELALDYEVAELEPLAFLLSRLLEALCARLATRSLAASALRLRLLLAPLSGRAAGGHEKCSQPARALAQFQAAAESAAAAIAGRSAGRTHSRDFSGGRTGPAALHTGGIFPSFFS